MKSFVKIKAESTAAGTGNPVKVEFHIHKDAILGFHKPVKNTCSVILRPTDLELIEVSMDMKLTGLSVNKSELK